MKKLLVCIDGSGYADNICSVVSWAANRINAQIDLLHVLRRHSDYNSRGEDHTGAIGIDARSDLLEKLTQFDEERGKLDQQKGKVILQHGVDVLKKAGVDESTINTIHRRGSLVDTLLDIEDDADIIVVGKRGEHANLESEFLGANLEKVARAVHKPLLVVSSVVRPIKRFLIAYDGKDNIKKGIDFISQSALFSGLECHLVAVENHTGSIDLTDAKTTLENAGLKVTSHIEKNSSPEKVITEYVVEHNIDLLVSGAYSHSRIRSMFLGSTTATLIKSCKVPLLLFK